MRLRSTLCVAVVGSGLAGSITARMLRQAGSCIDVTVYDDNDVFSASAASSNLYIGSWLKKFSREGQEGIQALESLDLHVEHPFAQGIADALRVKHIPQRSILVEVNRAEPVRSVDYQGSCVQINSQLHYDVVVLCCGHRAQELVPDLEVDVKVGHAMLLSGRLPEGKAALRLVSPYTHSKLYQYDDETIYFADSVAVKQKTYRRREYELKCRTRDRFLKEVGGEPLPNWRWRVGYRPIVKDSPFGVLREVNKHTFAINGGGKNGMVAYAYQARRLLGRLSEIYG